MVYGLFRIWCGFFFSGNTPQNEQFGLQKIGFPKKEMSIPVLKNPSFSALKLESWILGGFSLTGWSLDGMVFFSWQNKISDFWHILEAWNSLDVFFPNKNESCWKKPTPRPGLVLQSGTVDASEISGDRQLVYRSSWFIPWLTGFLVHARRWLLPDFWTINQ